MAQRYNARGRLIESRHGITPVAEGVFTCDGCGRQFTEHDGGYRPYSLALESTRLRQHTRARAMRHADACKAPTREERHAASV